jgi:endonuclease-8
MPEGPSIVILKEAVAQFKGKKILEAGGNTKVDLPDLQNMVVTDFKSWGKHFLICFKTFTIRIHFLLFGTYRINEKKDTQPRLSLRFNNGELNFYTCSIQLIKEDINEVYDWSADVMNKNWDPAKAKKKMKAQPAMLVCDALMNQEIFSGVGNIIKNEVLFRIKVPPAKMKALLTEAVTYSFEFLAWKKEFTLKKHWLCYNQKQCPRDHIPFFKKYLGKTHRKTFFCNSCEKLYV